MELDLSSYFAASLGLMLLLLVVRLIMFRTAFLLKFGITDLYIFVILIIIRGYFPFDFYKINLTTRYYSHRFLPLLQTISYYKISINDFCLSIKEVIIITLIMGCMLSLIHI